MADNKIRMSGMNSGLDTESIIKALTANSKLKITKQERNILKYQAQQEAYRDVISKLTDLKKSYFDILKKDSYLAGGTMWNKYSAKTLVDGTEKNIQGVAVSTTINSAAGNYKVKVNKTATQSKITGSSLSDGAKIDAGALTSGESYGITVTVGEDTKNITFTAGNSAEETIKNINDKLSEAYGESNSSAAGGSKGLVYVDDSGKFVSRAGKGISISGIGTMTGSNTLDLSGIKTGSNTLTFQAGEEVVNVSFQTLSSDYFNEIFDEDGNIKDDADEEKVALYNQIKDDYVESKKYEEYTAWADTATEDDKQALLDKAFAKAEEAQYNKYLDKFLSGKYDEYKAEGGDEDFDAWKAANYADKDENNALYKEFAADYYDVKLTDEQKAAREAELDTFLQEKYAEAKADGETAEFEDWKAANFKDKDSNNALYAEFKAIDDEKYPTHIGYQLDKDMWSAVSYKEYDAYKEELGSVSEDNLTITQQNIVDHYNATSIKNSIGSLETKEGVKFSVEINGGSAVVTAEDKDGNAQNISVTSAAGSTNNFGATAATTSVSQISNTTTLANLGIDADEDGNYSFTINGVDFTFSGDTTVNEMMKKVNGSDAGVKMAYSSLENAFTVTSTEYGTGSRIDISADGQGLLAGIGLMAGSQYSAGTNLEVEINGRILESDGNSIEADGTTFTFTEGSEGAEFTVNIEKDTAAIADTIKGFVEQYNKAIKEIYEYLDQEPEKKYYFLADADKEDLELTEKQEEQWEEKAKKGVIYHDSTISNAMTTLRMALMGTVEGADGKDFSLASLGITTATDYNEHGKLMIDEDKLNAAIAANSDDIAKLFSDKENGIMKKFADALEGAVGTTGDKGTLINKAGLATGSTAKDNEIYELIKRTTQKISSLTERYENEQDRLWKKYSAMEKMLSSLNSQQSSFSSYFQS